MAIYLSSFSPNLRDRSFEIRTAAREESRAAANATADYPECRIKSAGIGMKKLLYPGSRAIRIATVNLLPSAHNEFHVHRELCVERGSRARGRSRRRRRRRRWRRRVGSPVYLATFRVINGGFINDS